MPRALQISPFLLSLFVASPSFAQDVPEALQNAQAQQASTTTYPWQICNETSYVLRIAYGLSENEAVMVRGWQQVIPGACYQASYTDPNSPRYLYAESLPIHRGGIREWKGNVGLCAQSVDFASEAGDDCALKNFDTRQYLAVKPSESRTSLIEPSDFGPKAETAGVQRLLKDAGYKITRVDGLPGRRTDRSLRDFKKDAELDPGTEGATLIAALMNAAQESLQSVGLQLCNDGSQKVWGAIAVRDNGNWQSRGWWEIMPKECSQIYTKSLQGTEAHVYALQENPDPEDPRNTRPDKRLRSVSASPAQFCIAESRFSALGREYCASSGYVAANFRPVPTEDDGIKVTLNDSDFAEVGAAGLRR